MIKEIGVAIARPDSSAAVRDLTVIKPSCSKTCAEFAVASFPVRGPEPVGRPALRGSVASADVHPLAVEAIQNGRPFLLEHVFDPIVPASE